MSPPASSCNTVTHSGITRRRLAALGLIGLSLAFPPSAQAAEEPPGARPVMSSHAPPVPGRIVRGFEAPAGYARSGHRGVDFAAETGGAVRSSAGGVVVFAGGVAGSRWVSLRHADGIVTAYGPLGAVSVAVDDAVRPGQPLGRVAPGGHGAGDGPVLLHWSARRDGHYLDPLRLLESVPRPSLVADGGWTGTHHVTRPYEPWQGGRLGGMLTAPSPEATRPGYATAPNANHLVIVPGLATSSSSEVVDPAHLGYDPESVSVFSYAGMDGSDQPEPLEYGPQDTWAGPEPAARALAEHLAAVREAQPGRAVDVVAHSMGGIVAVRYLLEHHDAYNVDLPPIGNVVAFDTPFRGSDVASVGGLLIDDPTVGSTVVGLQRLTGIGVDHLPLDAPAISQLAVGSPSLEDLAADWEDGWRRAGGQLPTGPFAMRPRFLTIGGSRDLVVAAERAAQPSGPWYGAVGERERVVDGEVVVTHRILPGGHSSVLETEAAREVVYEFLAGDQPTRSPGRATSVIGRGVGMVSRIAVAAIEWIREDRDLW